MNAKEVPSRYEQLLAGGKAYFVTVEGGQPSLILFANAEACPCEAAPPRQYTIDRFSKVAGDYVLWTNLGGETVNYSRATRF